MTGKDFFDQLFHLLKSPMIVRVSNGIYVLNLYHLQSEGDSWQFMTKRERNSAFARIIISFCCNIKMTLSSV